MSNNKDGIEISYHLGNFLVGIISEGKDIWTCDLHDRNDVIKDLERLIDYWGLNAQITGNYISLKPIFCMVSEQSEPIIITWLCWTLANLTTFNRKFLIAIFEIINFIFNFIIYTADKYCPLIYKENGHSLLKPLISLEPEYVKIKYYGNIVCKNILQYCLTI
jgi:hypothetical protein